MRAAVQGQIDLHRQQGLLQVITLFAVDLDRWAGAGEGGFGHSVVFIYCYRLTTSLSCPHPLKKGIEGD
jgi:hypothetical protein